MEFKDLREAWVWINTGLLNGNVSAKISGSSCKLSDTLFLKVDTADCPIDLLTVGYTERKIKILESKYFDEDSYNDFVERVNKGRDSVYTFKSSKVYAGKPKPNCLLMISYNSNRKEYTVIWRTTELLCRFAADLIFLSRILEKNKTVNLILLGGYQYCEVLPGVFKMNGIKLYKPVNDSYARAIKNANDKFFLHDSEPYENWRPIWLVQRNYKKWCLEVEV